MVALGGGGLFLMSEVPLYPVAFLGEVAEETFFWFRV